MTLRIEKLLRETKTKLLMAEVEKVEKELETNKEVLKKQQTKTQKKYTNEQSNNNRKSY